MVIDEDFIGACTPHASSGPTFYYRMVARNQGLRYIPLQIALSGYGDYPMVSLPFKMVCLFLIMTWYSSSMLKVLPERFPRIDISVVYQITK